MYNDKRPPILTPIHQVSSYVLFFLHTYYSLNKHVQLYGGLSTFAHVEKPHYFFPHSFPSLSHEF